MVAAGLCPAALGVDGGGIAQHYQIMFVIIINFVSWFSRVHTTHSLSGALGSSANLVLFIALKN